MSRLTKIGLSLIPWWPMLLLVMIAREPGEFIVDDAPIERTQFALHIILNFLFAPFIIGLILLLVAGVRRVVRLRTPAA